MNCTNLTFAIYSPYRKRDIVEEKSNEYEQANQVRQTELKPVFKYEGLSEKGGVYRILNSSNGRYYYGSAKCFRERWHDHARSLRLQKHHNKFLQNDANKCGMGSLVFEVVEVVECDSKESRLEREAYYLGLFHDKQDACYNFDKKPNKQERSCFSKNPEETRRKISEVSKKNWSDPEFKEKVSTSIQKALSNPEVQKKKRESHLRSWDGNEERRKKRSEHSKKLMADPKHKEKVVSNLKEHQPRGRETYKKRISEDQDLRQRMQEIGRKNIAKRNATQPVKTYGSLVAPDGTIHEDVSHVPTFAKEHGLTKTALYQLLLGRTKSHKGWKLLCVACPTYVT